MSTKTYDCTVLIDASTSFIVEAGSPEEAAEKAELLAAEAGAGSLCHQCSDHTETGDFYGVVVYCDGTDVLDTGYQSMEILKLSAEVETLRTERDQLKAKTEERKSWMDRFVEYCTESGVPEDLLAEYKVISSEKKRVTRKGLSVTPKCGFSSFSAITPLQATEYNDRPGV
jgi:hypothetical protein